MKLFIKILKRIFLVILIYCVFLILYTFVSEKMYSNKYGVSTATENSEVIGTISIYSSPTDKFSTTRLTGHSWIYIENTTNSPFTINGVTVNPNKGITFGTTAHPDVKPSGIWFNVESYNTSYLENISLKSNFYKEDLEQLEIYLSKHNKWNILYNCATFSSGVWNNTFAGSVEPIYAISPKGLKRDISKISGYKDNEPFIINTNSVPYNEDIDVNTKKD